MKIGSRILTVVVALAMLATGPLAPLAAAQQPAQTPPPAMQPAAEPMQPAAEPMQPAAQSMQPAAQPMQPAAQSMQPMAPPQDLPEQDSRLAESAAYNVGAGIANVFYIPGKGLLCGLGGMVGIFIMIVSIGSAPKPAAYFAREGCGGKWVLTGDDIRPDDAHYRAFDWEQ
jgi:hypothetical protein